MLFDGIRLVEGSEVQNLVVDTGPSFPATPSEGELFYRNDGTNEGLYVYDGSLWVKQLGEGATIDTLLPDVATPGTYKSVTVDVKGRVTAGTNPTTLSGYNITDAQPLDADLTAIAAISATSGVLRKTASNTWVLDTTSYITGNQLITASGDVTGFGTTSLPLTLGTTGVAAGSYGTSSAIGTFVVDSKGRITSASNTSVSIDASAVTSGSFANARVIASNVTQHQAALIIAESQITDGALLARNAGNETITGTWTFNNPINGSVTSSTTSTTSAVLTNARSISASGDGTWNVSFDGSANVTGGLTFATVNSAPQVDAFRKITVNAKGLTTASSAVLASDIISVLGYTPVNRAGDTLTGNLVISTGSKLTLADAPTTGTDAVNKNYVDSAIAGLTWKNAVRVLSISNITLSGTQTIDGVAVVAGDRVLVMGQTNATENGIYVAQAGGWARSSDADTGTELAGLGVWVNSGTAYADSGWTCVNDTVNLGTDNISFVQFNGAAGITAGVGLLKSGNTLSVMLGAGIGQLPSTEVGVDVYVGGGLMTTLDGTTSSTTSNAQLSLTRIGTPGTYYAVTTDVYGRITAGVTPTGVPSATTYLRGDNTWGAITSSNAAINLANGATGSLPYQSAANVTSFLTAGTSSQVLISGASGPSWSSAPTITGTNFSGIPNAGLINSSLTIGITPVSLGGNTTTLAGLTSVTSSTFVGNLTGNASTVTTNANLTGDVTSVGNATTLANSGVTTGTYNNVTVDSKGRVTNGSNATYITGNQTITINGDATGAGNTTIPLTLVNTGITAGTYTKLTVDAKGRATVGALLASLDITTALGFTPARSGANSDITSLSGLTTALSVAQGGTGVTTSTGTGSNVLSISPAFTGTPTVPTASLADNSTTIASTAFVRSLGYLNSQVNNYATLDPANRSAGATLSNGNLTVALASNTGVKATQSFSSGQYYWETVVTTPGNISVGIATSAVNNSNFVAGANANNYVIYYTNGSIIRSIGGALTIIAGTAISANDRIGIHVNYSANTIAFYLNNVLQGTHNSIPTGTMFPFIATDTGTANATVNFGASAFTYSVPSGANAGIFTVVTPAGAVTSIAGTANQIIASASTGSVTLSLPQNINSGAAPTFVGTNFTGTATGLTAGAATTAGTVTTAAQPSITSVGTLTSLAVTGNISSSTGFVRSSVGTNISAAGTTLATATALTREINVVSTVAAGTGVQLPSSIGTSVIVVNNGANPLFVYPNSATASIDSAAAGVALSIPVGAKIMFICVSATQFYTLNATFA